MDAKRFEFGKNWTDYISKHFDEGAIISSKNHFCFFTGFEDIKNMTFVDIGCGSGLHSLTAYSLGAKKIVSFDYDKNSVNATKKVRQSVGEPENWEIMHGSILDDEFVKTLGTFSFVYSWGVLHHTGDMWLALRNTYKLISSEGGFLYIAIYNKDHGKKGSKFWLKEKRKYIHGNNLLKKYLFYKYFFKNNFLPNLLHLKNPFLVKKKRRGMSYYHDVLDWIGGYPYEFATSGEIFTFCKNELGLTLEALRTPGGLSNNEFLFKKNKSL